MWRSPEPTVGRSRTLVEESDDDDEDEDEVEMEAKPLSPAEADEEDEFGEAAAPPHHHHEAARPAVDSLRDKVMAVVLLAANGDKQLAGFYRARINGHTFESA